MCPLNLGRSRHLPYLKSVLRVVDHSFATHEAVAKCYSHNLQGQWRICKFVVATTWRPVGIAFTHHLFSLGFMSAFNFVKPSRGCVTDLTHLIAGYTVQLRAQESEAGDCRAVSGVSVSGESIEFWLLRGQLSGLPLLTQNVR